MQIGAVCLVVTACGTAPTSPTTSGSGGTSVLPLALTCPAALSTTSAATSLVVSFGPPATTGGTLPVTSSCTPASGSTFSRGTTTVTCRATDNAGQAATCTFVVTVLGVPLLTGTRFMAFGDSFTAGEVLDALSARVVSEAKSYPTQLRSLLLTRYVSQDIVVRNDGEPGEVLMSDLGYRSEETRLRYTRALTLEHPDAVLLLEGVNDLSSDGITTDQIAGVLGQMVQEAYAANVKVVYLATEPPQIPGRLRSAHASRVPDLNAKIRVVATQQHATLVDLYPAMIGNVNNLINSDDGLHPYPAGYAVIAETFFTAIKSNFEQVASSSLTHR